MKYDLIIRLDELGEKLVFFTRRISDENDKGSQASPPFSVEISLAELKNRGAAGAEKLIGESVLGFFDHLTDGRIDLPKHYRDDLRE